MTEPRVIAEIRLVHPELVLTPTIDRVPEVVSFQQRESPAVHGVDESGALVRTPEREAFWGRA